MIIMTMADYNRVDVFEVNTKCLGISQSHIRGGTRIHENLGYVTRHSSVEGINQILTPQDNHKPSLFAYPAQSNFSGVKHPLSWVANVQSKGYDVLVDAAAFVATNRLSLRNCKPDFVCVSFYKMFGLPTGVGALIVRDAAIKKLRRPWFSGGTVRFVSTQNDLHLLKKTVEAFEGGTLNFLNITAVQNGLDFLDQVGIERINSHVSKLAQLLLESLQALHHSNGKPLIVIYGPSTMQDRGATVAFNLLDINGNVVDYKLVESRANNENISIRTGCFCNPGAAEFAFRYTAAEAHSCFDRVSKDFSLEKFSECMEGKPVGALRASLGIATNQRDVQELINVLSSFLEFKIPASENALTTSCGR